MNYERNVVTLLSFAFISFMTDWKERINSARDDWNGRNKMWIRKPTCCKSMCKQNKKDQSFSVGAWGRVN